ncbi:hypothetical protein OSB04_000970 [Centaurea solstitialis]|uniref:Transposase MuDR plant domain-containing protein n=1 Tax=Centaurea solstitialis TaxID=347529 RepID=A0AA38TQF0_9ASTR|nr:hypothetical protein OSB04_000970 [Centaurea solstitialis]
MTTGNKDEQNSHLHDNGYEQIGEDDSNYCPSEESYHSHLSEDNVDELMNDEDEACSFSKNGLSMKVNLYFENVIEFRKALNHYAITNEFDYFIQKSDPTRFTTRCENINCEFRIHASIMQDRVTFENVCNIYSNFKKHFLDEFFNKKLWSAAKTYRLAEHDRSLKEIAELSEDAITFLNNNHNKIWSRSKFGTTFK